MVNNLVSGSDLDPCDYDLYDNNGKEIHKNIAQASISRIKKGKKFNQRNTCLICNSTWLDFKENYATRCKCGSQKILGAKHEPEKILSKVLRAADHITFGPPMLPKITMPKSYNHEDIYRNALAQGSTPEEDKVKKRKNLRRVMQFSGLNT